jgi:hypothetical protein
MLLSSRYEDRTLYCTIRGKNFAIFPPCSVRN